MSRSTNGFLPRAVRRGKDFLDTHPLHAVPKLLVVDLVAVVEEIGWGGLVRERVDELLGRPGGGGMRGDVEVDYAPAVMGKHNENEQDTEANGGHGEEVDRDEVADVIGEERPPGLRGLGTTLRHEAGDGALGDVDAELEKLAVDARRTPQGVSGGHLPDEGSDLGIDARTTAGRPTREPGPILAEAAALPAQDVSGETMTSAFRQPVQTLARPAQNRRSIVWSFGRGMARL